MELHKRMQGDGSIIWIPEYGTESEKKEVHLVAVSYIDKDEKWEAASEPFAVFLAYVSPQNRGRSDNQSDPKTRSPVLCELRRLWENKPPLVLDIDETLGCSPRDSFAVSDAVAMILPGVALQQHGSIKYARAADLVKILQELAEKNDGAMGRHYTNKSNEALQIKTRAVALDLVNSGSVDIGTTAGLLDGENGERHHKICDGHAYFTRPHLNKLLQLARKEFTLYLVTASSRKHALDFCSTFDSVNPEEKHGTWLTEKKRIYHVGDRPKRTLHPHPADYTILWAPRTHRTHACARTRRAVRDDTYLEIFFDHSRRLPGLFPLRPE